MKDSFTSCKYFWFHITSRWGWKSSVKAEPEPKGNGEPRKNPGVKPGKVAEKHPGAGCEAMTEEKRSQRKKTASDGIGRDLEVRRNSSGRIEIPVTFAFRI